MPQVTQNVLVTTLATADLHNFALSRSTSRVSEAHASLTKAVLLWKLAQKSGNNLKSRTEVRGARDVGSAYLLGTI